MKKALLIIGLLFCVGCTQKRQYESYRPSPSNYKNRDNVSNDYADINRQDAAFITNLEQGLAEIEADSKRLYAEAVELSSHEHIVFNDQHHIFTSLTDDQLALCQAYLEYRRNHHFDPKTLVLLRAVEKSLSAESVCAPESNPALSFPNKYVLLVAIWDARARIDKRMSEILAEMKAGLDRDAQLREGGKLYLENLHADRSRLAEKSMELTDEIRQLNYDRHLQSIEQSLREMSRHQPPPTRPMGSMELYQNYENRARQLNRDNDLGSIEQSLREMSRYQKYGY